MFKINALYIVVLATSLVNAAPPDAAVYLHGNLIDTATGEVRRDVAIGVRGDRIEDVRPVRDYAVPKGLRTVDLRGKYVLPGLINSHVHLATTPDGATARRYLRRELLSGVTTVRDMAGDARLLAELKREADFDEIASPDIVYSALFAGPSFFSDPRTLDSSRGWGPGQAPWMRAVTADSNLAMLVAEAHGTGATGIKLYADLPAGLVPAVVAEAHRQHLMVWAHAALFPAKPSDVVAAGVDVMSHACLLGYEVSDPPLNSAEEHRRVDEVRIKGNLAAIEAVLAQMKERGTILDATVSTYELSPALSCTGRQSDDLAQMAYRAGVSISVGTDDDADFTQVDSVMDAELEMLVGKVGMSTQDALKSATVIGARAVGQAERIGTLEPGKLANFVVVDRNPLEDIHNVRSVYLVVKHGIPRLRHARAAENQQLSHSSPAAFSSKGTAAARFLARSAGSP